MHELTRLDRRAKVLGPTGVEPSQSYGGTAVGADESIIKKQKQNLAAASGRGLRKGASATIAIEWTWGKTAQPDVRAHVGHIEAWLRYYDEHKDENLDRIRRAWKKHTVGQQEQRSKGRRSPAQCDLQCPHA